MLWLNHPCFLTEKKIRLKLFLENILLCGKKFICHQRITIESSWNMIKYTKI